MKVMTMRRLILSTLLLAAATPVLAQMSPPAQSATPARDERAGERRDERRDQRPDEHRDQRPDARRDQRPDDRGGYRLDDRRHDDRGYRQDERRDERRDVRQDERRDIRQDGRRDFRQDERRDYRDDRRAYGDGDRFARFHGNAYYYPRGYGYRAYGIGALLPRVFFDQRYYIGQPDFYRLPPAYAGTRWVRVGPDALLIRNYDGRIIRVLRGLFY